MNYKITSNTALIIIDVQQGFDDPKWGQKNNPNAEGNISRLISFWKNKKRPIIHIQHRSVESDSPIRPNQPGVEFKQETMPERCRIVPELKDQGIIQYRELIVPPWRIMFKITNMKVYVLLFIDSRRNIEDILFERLTYME